MASMSPTRDRIADLLAPVLADEGLDLEAVELASAGRRSVVRVVVDADGGVSLDRIAETSHRIAGTLDDSDVMGSASYTLEVTSRGVDRPLTLPRHWRRNIGRLVKVTTREGTVTGRITGSDDEGAELDVSGQVRRFSYASVVKAKVQVEFGRFPDEGGDLDEEAPADGH